MTADQIVEAVRACVRGEKPQNDISDILRAHRCYALIKQGNTAQEMMERVVNLAAVKERYRVCEPFFKNASFPINERLEAIANSIYDNFLQFLNAYSPIVEIHPEILRDSREVFSNALAPIVR